MRRENYFQETAFFSCGNPIDRVYWSRQHELAQPTNQNENDPPNPRSPPSRTRHQSNQRRRNDSPTNDGRKRSRHRYRYPKGNHLEKHSRRIRLLECHLRRSQVRNQGGVQSPANHNQKQKNENIHAKNDLKDLWAERALFYIDKKRARFPAALHPEATGHLYWHQHRRILHRHPTSRLRHGTQRRGFEIQSQGRCGQGKRQKGWATTEACYVKPT